mgnify:CR=1 FL=1
MTGEVKVYMGAVLAVVGAVVREKGEIGPHRVRLGR